MDVAFLGLLASLVIAWLLYDDYKDKPIDSGFYVGAASLIVLAIAIFKNLYRS